MGAVGAPAHDRPLRQISSLTPASSAHHHGGSAAPSSFDMGQLMAMLAEMKEMNANARAMERKMDVMENKMDTNTRNMQRMDGNVQALRVICEHSEGKCRAWG